MLVLTRRQGESLRIGKDKKITVLNIEKNKVRLRIDDNEELTIRKWKSKVISDGIKISLEKVNINQVKLGIRAPESMDVKREEVYEKEQDGDVQSYCSGVINNTENQKYP
jgi:carbon storage regulator CsrA